MLVLSALLRVVQLRHGVVLLSRVGLVDGRHVHGLVRDLGELLLFLLFLELALLFLSSLEGLLFGTLERCLLDGLLDLGGSLPEVVDVHDQVGEYEQDQRDNKCYTGAELD